jgi:hypothetical protein
MDIRAALIDAASLLLYPKFFYKKYRDILPVRNQLVIPAILVFLIPSLMATVLHNLWLAASSSFLKNMVMDLITVGTDILFLQNEAWGRLVLAGQEALSAMASGFMPVILTQVVSALRFALYVVMIHGAAMAFKRTAGGAHLTTTFKLAAFAQMPWVLTIIPGFGSVLAWCLSLYSLAEGVGHIYKVPLGRGFIVAMAPYLVILSLGFILIVSTLSFLIHFLSLIVTS